MILITGASSGIGAATAQAFAEKGRNLILVARRLDRLESLASDLRSKFSVQVKVLSLDLSDSAAVQQAIEQNKSEWSQVEVLVSNAGLAKGMAPLDQISTSQIQQMWDVNVNSVIQLSQFFLPIWAARHSGHLILLGSVAGRWAYPNGNVYCATKAAIHSLAQTIRLDYLGKGIRVTEISPGMVETEFSQVRFEDSVRAKAVYQGMTPLSAVDIARSIQWATEQPKHVNIQELVIYPTDQASPNHVFRR